MDNKIPMKEYAPGDVIFDALTEISDGRLLTQLDEKVASLVSAVLKTGNKGTLSLSLSVKRKGGEGQVEITPSLKVNIPNKSIPARILFADEKGGLHTDDPNQRRLNLEGPMRVFPRAAAVAGA